jgi:hypothetical protein
LEFVHRRLQASQLLVGILRLGVDNAGDVEKLEMGLFVSGVPDTLDGLRRCRAGIFPKQAGDRAFFLRDFPLPLGVFVGSVKHDVRRLADHRRIGLAGRIGVERNPVEPADLDHRFEL